MNGQQSIPQPTAMQVEALAAEWLARKKEFGNWSDEEQGELDAWLRESPAHLLAYTRLDEAWKSADRLFALRTSSAQKSSVSKTGLPYLRIAAVLAVLGVAAIVAESVRPQNPNESIFSTPVGGRQVLTLADGSRMELNTNTVLRVALGRDHRTIWLDKGEAYFQVKHDAARPFVIYANGRRITDLGTKFLVRKDSDRLEVSLLEGRVRLDAATDEPQAMTVLGAGDDAIASGNTTSVSKEPIRDVLAKLGWQRGVITFDHTTLADAAAEFNRYNTTKIVITDAAVGAITIDGTFPTGGVTAFAQAARDTFKLHARQIGNEIIVSR